MADSGENATAAAMGAVPLRPIERVMRRLADDGMSESEIAWRFRRTPGHVRRVLELSRRRQPSVGPVKTAAVLRPIERLVLRSRQEGAAAAEIAARLRRTPRGVEQIEELAAYKLKQLDGR